MASNELSEIGKYDEVLNEYSETIERIMYELQDTCRDLRNYKENIDFEFKHERSKGPMAIFDKENKDLLWDT